ncbi:putative motility protein [Brevibacillus brevis]|uniref:Motility protein n=1 Tax=Brevibacillus brevis TaxID=1393 RepID=A0ABY9T2W9_BREBE|nr:putative motility protein [Brevibacillus brevis]WNC14453.1 putative motility protein [Brevibacillus brevis]
MNINQLHQAINLSLQKQVQDAAATQAAVMLQDFAQTQSNIRAAEAPHPTLGKTIDILT